MDGERNTALGEFLRARRALVRPEQVGLSVDGRRRVPGLRRDEVAWLAGLSAGYYARLEQGHERPTRRTVESLKRALCLDESGSTELHRLARPTVGRRSREQAGRVSSTVLALLNDWTSAPAYVLDWSHDVLARNALAAALHSRFVHSDNLLRMIFLDPAGREFFRDWASTARAAIRDLRQATAHPGADERGLRELIGELSIASPEFRRLWAGREPRGTIAYGSHFFHPAVGELCLRTEVFPITSAPGQRLVAQPAEPRSRSADSLAMLGVTGSG
ncbi:helix-turn-helix domain-containing protein [Kibdelosporangium persicum]|uniref:Transcriptional regulator n=1 Tax=Kibdelosporangium persicum TaxID=2698649 RepID=A0ABX2FFW3_9PSEU|nr:helix-turn-helix transcriptional regulator [Kibdelosporangium persicum]NRN70177.1 Transcriptional regulator [Kibdelosporangium persicum]